MAVDLEASANFYSPLFFPSPVRIEEFIVAHFPKPFFEKARKSWYVEINRKQIKLGADKEKAFQQYHQLMQQPAEEATARSQP